MKIYFPVFISVLFFIGGCKPKPNLLEKFDRATLFKNMAEGVMTPAYNEFNNAVVANQISTSTFIGTVNTLNLSTVRMDWNMTVLKWMRCEMFNFEYANAVSLNAQIGATAANYEVIETEIHGSNIIDESYITTAGTTRKGLAAIEYLLYGINGEQAVIDSFTTSAFAQRRKQYLTSLLQHVHTQTSAAYNSWNGGNSYSNFVAQTQLDISGSLNLMVNALTEHIEFTRRGKIGKPSGIENAGIVDTTLCEYRLAKRSIQNIRENIAAWKVIFTGNTGIGLDDYLDHVNAQYNGAILSTTIAEQIDLCLTKANAISVPLTQATFEQPTQVSALHLEIKKLTVLTKIDLASNLGVVITFSDNDGD